MKTLREVTASTREKAIDKLEEVETRILAAEGRKAIKAKVRTTTRVAKKAVRTGAIVGAATAVAVVVREVRKRRKLNA